MRFAFPNDSLPAVELHSSSSARNVRGLRICVRASAIRSPEKSALDCLRFTVDHQSVESARFWGALGFLGFANRSLDRFGLRIGTLRRVAPF